jgi:hypothetical protein
MALPFKANETVITVPDDHECAFDIECAFGSASEDLLPLISRP